MWVVGKSVIGVLTTVPRDGNIDRKITIAAEERQVLCETRHTCTLCCFYKESFGVGISTAFRATVHVIRPPSDLPNTSLPAMTVGKLSSDRHMNVTSSTARDSSVDHTAVRMEKKALARSECRRARESEIHVLLSTVTNTCVSRENDYLGNPCPGI